MTRPTRVSVTGHYAGPVSRATAAALDVGIIVAAYTVGYAGLGLLLDAFLSYSLKDERGTVAAVAMTLWSFCYVFASLAVAGRTPGKHIVGLRVVRADGATLTTRAALARTLLLPLSTLALGLGLVPIVLHREHRALHDLLAGTAVVHDWGDRPAELPAPLSDYLSRAHVTPAAPDPTPGRGPGPRGGGPAQ